MIVNRFLIPEFYVKPTPMCDNCKIELEDLGIEYLSNPPLSVYKCPKCNKEYKFTKGEITGYWKWRIV